MRWLGVLLAASVACAGVIACGSGECDDGDCLCGSDDDCKAAPDDRRFCSKDGYCVREDGSPYYDGGTDWRR